MRPELNEIQYIEFYLQGKLDSAQRLEFEKKMLSDPAFKEKVELQQQLMQGVENRALRNNIAKAYSKFKFKKNLKWGIGGAMIVVIIATFLVILSGVEGQSRDAESNSIIYDLSPEQLAGNSLESQYFEIDGSRDTVILSEDGILFAIEAGTFIDSEGNPVDGKIQVAVKEALKVDDILSSGLSTVTTSGEQLETGGMFSINARTNNNPLGIDPEKGIYTQVPTEEVKPGMQLWKGKYQKDGQLLWEEPKELEKFLIPVDMSLLNFYPKDFESNLERLGFPNASKRQKDSVYYSFGSHFTKKGREQFLVEDEHFKGLTEEERYDIEVQPEEYYRYPIKSGLNPAKVKAFWNDKFNGSLMATKEFESRMHLIHQTGSDEILDLYIKNAGEKISEIDLMAAEQSMGKLKDRFNEFAKLNQGRVESNPRLVKMINNFYHRKELAYKQAFSKANSFWKEQQQKDKAAQKMLKKYTKKEQKRRVENFKKELQDNLDTVYKQLGYKTAPRVTFNARVTSVGWNNVDRKVYAATVSRSSMTVTENGKTAKLSYSKLQLKTKRKFDRAYAYLLTPSLPSYQRMNYIESSDKHVFKLNDFYRYGLAVIGYKGDSAFTYFEPLVKSDSVYATSGDSVRLKSVELKSQSEKDFYKTIKRFSKNSSFKTDVKKDLLFEKFFQEEKARQFKLQEMINFRREIQEYVFPVYYLSPDQYELDCKRRKAERLTGFKKSDLALVFIKAEYNREDIKKRHQERFIGFAAQTLGFIDKEGIAYAQVDKRGEYFNARFLKEGIKGILSFDFVKEAESEVENFSMVKQDQYWVANSFKERGLKLFFIESDFEVLISEVASSFEMDEAVEE